MAGTTVSITWRDRPASAWVPDPTRDLDLELPSGVVRSTERAAGAVRLADQALPPSFEPLARFLLRAEGVASSDIEGLRAPIDLVAAAELDVEAVAGPAAGVADNLAVVVSAIAEPPSTLTLESLHVWHTRLMAHAPIEPKFVGRFREAQGWIGGNSPLDAVYVPPPADLVPALMDDLVAFANRDDVDPVTQAAVVHAQFETVHPYGDGNGRLGRVLIAWVLARRLGIAVPPPVSVLLARDVGGYLSGLYQFRVGEIATWVGWFAEVVERAAGSERALVERVAGLLAEWHGALSHLRADAGARAALELLPEHPVVTARLLSDRLGLSERAARDALSRLAEHGIVEPLDVRPTTPGRPRRFWLARALLETLPS